MSEIDNLHANRTRAARQYATAASHLADALERNPAAFHETYLLMANCGRAWNRLVRADRAVQSYVAASDPIDDVYREQAALDGVAEGTTQ